LTACAGCLAPHLWLSDGSSLYDHLGLGFTLLMTDGDDGGTDAAVAAAAQLGLPLTLRVPQDVQLRGRFEARFALIRPDQHVAWRGDHLPRDVALLLRRVT
jgi:hypothetical protein